MDGPEELLLSEVCQELGIVTYHLEVKPFKVVTTGSGAGEPDVQKSTVLMVRIITAKDDHLLPNQCVDGEIGTINENDKLLKERGVQMLDTILQMEQFSL